MTQPWPRYARMIAALKIEGETGVGTTLTRLLKLAGGDVFKHVMQSLGRRCGCEDRAAWLDERYPYTAQPDPRDALTAEQAFGCKGCGQ